MRAPHRVFWLALAALIALAPPSWAQYSRLSGTVTDQSGEPVEHAAVQLHNSNNLPATLKTHTDKKGKFSFGRLIDGDWQLAVEAQGFQPHQAVVAMDADEQHPPLQIQLVRLAPAAAATGDQQAGQARALFQQGVDAFRAGDHAAALQAFHSFRAQQPDNSEVLLNIALCHHALDQLAEAIAAYRGYLNAKPGHLEAQIKLGEALVQHGEFDAGLVELKAALEQRPDDALLCYNVGEIYFSAERRELAIEHYGRAIALDPALADAYLKLAYCHLALDHKAEALPHLKKYLELRPDAANAATIHGLIEQLEAGA
jgi:tetratricopeptide (TPR) repeat protein